MAIVQNPITGRTRKKFGTAVFSKQFEQNTMRTKPMEVKNPRTKGQVKQRNKFSTTVELVRQVLPIINEAYDGTIRKMSPFNKIVSINVKNAFDADSVEIDHTKVVLCEFDGSTVSNVDVQAHEDQEVQITWTPNTSIKEELDSEVSFILFNKRTNEAEVYKNVAIRSLGTETVKAPSSWVGDSVALHFITFDYKNLRLNRQNGC